ncbi:MAG: hypothetical protein HZB65_01175 [Candidatus Aenigmarchaeota archaeon]|nr:hypothetical protein [Candidatus Aenigmarchaeota archaeon]
MNETESKFVERFGNTPQVRVIDFLIENRVFDHSKTEIAEGSSVTRKTLDTFFDNLIKTGMVTNTRKIGRALLYELNKKNTVVQKLLEIDKALNLEIADEIANDTACDKATA